MASNNFLPCHAETAKWEGGWSDHPADPGGKTMYGVTEAVYHEWLKNHGKPPAPVRNISKEDALALYKERYWNPVGAEALPFGVDLAVYDGGVNSGIGRGNKWKAAAKGMAPDAAVKKICALRLSFVQSLGTFKVFGKGWSRRIAGIEAKGVSWALTAMGKSKIEVKEILANEGKTASNTAVKNTTIAATSTAGSATPAAVPDTAQNAADSVSAGGWAIAAFVIILLMIAVYFAVRAKIHSDRATAYSDEAKRT